ncbi:hypothetical protein M422DRAFT_778481 [Sphaerobolus stellatus SS14]|nr:hypothetical protein M422DRAFT_778481 [Sphaerobolus stellatus SS14]
MHRLTYQLKQAYGAALPVRFLPSLDQIPSDGLEVFQTELVDEIIFSPHFQTYPPSYVYRRAFWKYLVEQLESLDQEVNEAIYDEYLAILSNKDLAGTTPPPPCYQTHFWNINTSTQNMSETSRQTTLLESRTMIESGTTGLHTWGASLALAEWLILHPDTVQNRKVLELGSGIGFLGLIIAEIQLAANDAQGHLTLSDVNSKVIERCSQNFYLPCNRMSRHPSVSFRSLDWNDSLDTDLILESSPIREILNEADVILGADLVYDDSILPALTATISLFIRLKSSNVSPIVNDSVVYIATTVRREHTLNEFKERLESHGLAFAETKLSTVTINNQFLGGLQDIGCPIILYQISLESG